MRRLWIITALCLLIVGISAVSADAADLSVFSVSAISSQASTTFVQNTSGTVTVLVANISALDTVDVPIPLQITVPSAFTVGAITRSDNFTCVTAANVVTCTIAAGSILAGNTETIIFQITATTVATGVTVAAALVAPWTDANNANNTRTSSALDIVAPTATPTRTPTPTASPSSSPFPTFPVPTFTPTTNPFLVTPSAIPVTATATIIPQPPTRTPLPRPANAGLAVPLPNTGVRVVTNRDDVNVRLVPAIGAEVVAYLPAGYDMAVEARSADNEWVRVDLSGQQGWVGFPVITVIEGDLNNAPVADPRTIPFGGWENPRAGLTSVTSQYTGRLANSGIRVRGGPSQGYPVLANAPRYTVFSLLGRTAANNWVQVNFEGTLGWVASEFVEFQQGLGVLDLLPIGGIVADALPVSEPTGDAYNDTLSLLLARTNIAQESLDAIRAIWTQIALGNRVECGNYPARPSDYNIPLPVLSAFSATLTPLERDFNQAMANIRAAIDGLIDICSRPQPAEGYVGQAVVVQALDLVNAADGLLANIRAILTPLVNDLNRVPTEDECRFTYNNQSEIVPRLRIGQPRTASLSTRRYVRGFCFDGGVGQTLRLEILRTSGNIEPQVTVSPFSNPTGFLGTARISGQTEPPQASIASITITETGQYIVIVSDLEWNSRTLPPDGEFAILLSDVSGAGGSLSGLGFDASGNLVITTPTIAAFTPGVNTGVCPNISYTCAQLSTCEQARACLAAGSTTIDGDFDGVPCEDYLCTGFIPTNTPAGGGTGNE
ncbi:MAG: SH3 domain-containing protein [Chloroflexi bacterium]|nr:SH3 domain-containing protein [Chloroflexota bacterium]